MSEKQKPDFPAARRLVRKVLTLELFRWDRTTKKRGPVEARVRGWDEADAFFKQHGTALVRTTEGGVPLIQMPEGWDSIVVGMENFYSDGSVENL